MRRRFSDHYRGVRAMVTQSPERAILRILDLEAEVDRAKQQLAGRLQQLRFTDHCAMHGLDYSETCGACHCASVVADYGTGKMEES